jgi:hypothetical protein
LFSLVDDLVKKLVLLILAEESEWPSQQPDKSGVLLPAQERRF